MQSFEEIEHQQRLLSQYRSNLKILLEQLAYFGGRSDAPKEVLARIDETRRDIARLKSTLREWDTDPGDLPYDEDIQPATDRVDSRSEPALSDIQAQSLPLVTELSSIEQNLASLISRGQASNAAATFQEALKQISSAHYPFPQWRAHEVLADLLLATTDVSRWSEAASFYRQALEQLADQPSTALRLHCKLSGAYARLMRLEQADLQLHCGEQLLQQEIEPLGQALLLATRAHYYAIDCGERHAEAIQLCHTVIELLAGMSGTTVWTIRATALYVQGVCACRLGQLDQGLIWLRQADSDWQCADNTFNQAFSRYQLGKELIDTFFENGSQYLNDSLKIAQQTGNATAAGLSAAALASAMILRADYATAKRLLQKWLPQFRNTNTLPEAHLLSASAELERTKERWPQAITYYQQALHIVGHPSRIPGVNRYISIITSIQLLYLYIIKEDVIQAKTLLQNLYLACNPIDTIAPIYYGHLVICEAMLHRLDRYGDIHQISLNIDRLFERIKDSKQQSIYPLLLKEIAYIQWLVKPEDPDIQIKIHSARQMYQQSKMLQSEGTICLNLVAWNLYNNQIHNAKSILEEAKLLFSRCHSKLWSSKCHYYEQIINYLEENHHIAIDETEKLQALFQNKEHKYSAAMCSALLGVFYAHPLLQINKDHLIAPAV